MAENAALAFAAGDLVAVDAAACDGAALAARRRALVPRGDDEAIPSLDATAAANATAVAGAALVASQRASPESESLRSQLAPVSYLAKRLEANERFLAGATERLDATLSSMRELAPTPHSPKRRLLAHLSESAPSIQRTFAVSRAPEATASPGATLSFAEQPAVPRWRSARERFGNFGERRRGDAGLHFGSRGTTRRSFWRAYVCS